MRKTKEPKVHFVETMTDLNGISHSDNVLFFCEKCRHYHIKCMRSMIAKPFMCRSCICRENILKPEAIKKKEDTSLRLYGSKTFRNNEKAKKTNKEKSGYENPWQNPQHHKNLDKVFEEKFGSRRPFGNKKILDKAIENRDYDKIKETNIKRHGVSAGFLTDLGKENRTKALIKKYGTDKLMHIPEIVKKSHKKYFVEGLWFDSKPEYKIYKFLKEHNIDFEYQPDVSFIYESNGKKHLYYPDFIIEDEYYEYKGLHFFENHDPTKKMICPFRYKNETEEQFKLRNIHAEDKHQCMIKFGVHIVTDINEIFNKFK